MTRKERLAMPRIIVQAEPADKHEPVMLMA